jgi:tetratricopeptide (TPR) repeat protein
LIDLAKYTAATWPDREQGDDAHLNLGLIYQGRGQYDLAIAEFAAVRERSPKRLEAQTRLGGAHWAKSRMLDRRGDKDKSASEAKTALDLLDKTLKARQAAGAGPTDAGLIGNAADLGVALTETGKVTEALALLDPINKAQTVKTGVPFIRLKEATLLAQINSGQVEPAIATMKALEESGTTTARPQLYLRLSKLLERELNRLREKKDTASLNRMQDSYKSFLMALAESKAGQTYESLEGAGEGLLSIDAFAEAEKVLQRLLDEAISNPAFLRQAGGNGRILRTKIKLSTALRGQGKFDRASSLVDEMLAQYPRIIEPLVEKGMLLESEAEAGQGSWSAAFAHWQDLAQKLSRMRPRPQPYYDALYHAAWALSRQKQGKKARQVINAVMRLNPDVGSPEMKAKYEQFLERIK